MQDPSIPLIVLKAAAADRRYLAENLAILDPREGLARVVYREVWVAPPLRADLPGLAGRAVYIVFFDHDTQLLRPVRAGRVAHVERRDGRVRLAIALGDFVRSTTELRDTDLPRLPDEGFTTQDARPPDGRGRHAIVFERPAAWRALDEQLPVDTAEGWAELVADLAAPAGSPYRDCRFVLLTSEQRLAVGARRVAAGGRDDGAAVKLLVVSPSTPGPVEVQLIAYAGATVYWRASRSLPQAQLHELTVPWPRAELRAPQDGPLRVEAFAWAAKPSQARVSVLEVDPPRAAAPPVERNETTSLAAELALDAILAHMQPRDEAQRALCRQLIEGIEEHHGVRPELIDRLLAWELPEEAWALLAERPGLARHEAGHRQLERWLRKLAACGPEHSGVTLRLLVEAALLRLPQSPDTELLDTLLDALGTLEGKDFWDCLGLGDSGDVLDLPLVAAAYGAPAQPQDRGAKLAELIDAHRDSAPDAQLGAALELCEKLDAGSAWRLARRLAAKRRPVPWIRVLPEANGHQLADVLPLIAPTATHHELVAQWYWTHHAQRGDWPREFLPDLLLWLLHGAPEAQQPPWIAQLADAALEQEDYWLLTQAKARGATLDAERREAIRATLATLDLDAQWDRIAKRLAHKTVLVLGGAYSQRENWQERLAVDHVHIKLRWQTTAGTVAERDLPDDVDYCIVLKWAGHKHSVAATQKYGRDLVAFAASGGFAGFRERLAQWGGRLVSEADPD